MSETKTEAKTNFDSLISEKKQSIDSKIREIQKKKDIDEENKLR